MILFDLYIPTVFVFRLFASVSSRFAVKEVKHVDRIKELNLSGLNSVVRNSLKLSTDGAEMLMMYKAN